MQIKQFTIRPVSPIGLAKFFIMIAMVWWIFMDCELECKLIQFFWIVIWQCFKNSKKRLILAGKVFFLLGIYLKQKTKQNKKNTSRYRFIYKNSHWNIFWNIERLGKKTKENY